MNGFFFSLSDWSLKIIHFSFQLDNELTNLPLSRQNGRLEVIQQGRNVIVQTDFGLKVVYNTIYSVTVIVPSVYRQRMCGLCGNNNNNPRDDFKLRDGRRTNDVDMFGKSWALDEDSKACGGCGRKCPKCPKAKAALYQKPNSCGIIANPDGPFNACHKKVDPLPYLSQCVFDVCTTGGTKDALCAAVLDYALACQWVGVEIQPWRSDSFCRKFGPAAC